VTMTFANASPIEHNMTVSQGATVLAATPTFTGGSRTLTIKLKPGTYTFYCSVPGHRQAGMEGTLKIS
jgi:plastocyanin